MSSLPELSVDELAVIYSAAILADDDVSITVDKISTLLKAANVDVEPIWPALYARALTGLNIRQLLTSTVACGPGPTAASAPPAAPVGGLAVEPSKAAEAAAPAKGDDKEEDEDDDEDLGMNLFDFD